MLEASAASRFALRSLYSLSIARCPNCHLAVWSNYAGAGPVFRFIRVGTLDTPSQLSPDIHIFTSTKQHWVVLPPEAVAMPEFYDRKQHWSAESLQRLVKVLPQLQRYREQQEAG